MWMQAVTTLCYIRISQTKCNSSVVSLHFLDLQTSVKLIICKMGIIMAYIFWNSLRLYITSKNTLNSKIFINSYYNYNYYDHVTQLHHEPYYVTITYLRCTFSLGDKTMAFTFLVSSIGFGPLKTTNWNLLSG